MSVGANHMRMCMLELGQHWCIVIETNFITCCMKLVTWSHMKSSFGCGIVNMNCNGDIDPL
jgi:hypothetical protein